jgi:D-amino peptidase
MVQEINSSFDALVLIGYHSPSGSRTNPLAHTWSPDLNRVLLNGQLISEFHLIAMTAAYEQVPVVFVSGDEALCELVKAYDPKIATVATVKGIGESVWGIHPQEAIKQIKTGVERSLKNRAEIQIQPLPKHFQLELEYQHPPEAYKSSFYPGARLTGEQSAVFETTDWFDVMRSLLFMV